MLQDRLGAYATTDGVHFAAYSSSASALWVSIFDDLGRQELERVPLSRGEGSVWSTVVAGLKPGVRYGLRADGEYDPGRGLWFDPDKLLVDPYAVEIDRPYVYDGRLALRRGAGADTGPLMPKAIVPGELWQGEKTPPVWKPGGLIYEVPVRAFTMRHPHIEPRHRGMIAALAEPAIVEHLQRIGVSAVELMPVAAWIDERHLEQLGLRNAWGYNPVTFMALEPELAPAGLEDLRQTVSVLHKAGIGVILDVVFNHTGESDEHGPTLSMRGLDNSAYYRHAADHPGRLVNDTGTGNTLACDHPVVQRLVLDSLRHFVRHAGIDGFRFDLATVLGRGPMGFRRDSALLQAMVNDPEIGDRILIAEPWDIGFGGYQLGSFPEPFLEWNDRYRDDVRRFWRGDEATIGALATRLTGSSDVFGGARATRTVNFIAAHDGMTLADLVSYSKKQNGKNGEHNHDGHHENFSWNNGAEGPTDDPKILHRRQRDLRALLATLFASRGPIMLTAGDEFGRSQDGNNNAYAQDNEVTWLDWNARDSELEAFVGELARLRLRAGLAEETAFLTGAGGGEGEPDVRWLTPEGGEMSAREWEEPGRRCLSMLLAHGPDRKSVLGVLVNGSGSRMAFTLPGDGWRLALLETGVREVTQALFEVPARSVAFVEMDGMDATGETA